jgi:serine/threonine protein kinase
MLKLAICSDPSVPPAWNQPRRPVDHKGVVHGSLSPEKIVVHDDGRVQVTDLGMSELLELLGVHLKQGASAYLAPERLDGMPADARASPSGPVANPLAPWRKLQESLQISETPGVRGRSGCADLKRGSLGFREDFCGATFPSEKPSKYHVNARATLIAKCRSLRHPTDPALF